MTTIFLSFDLKDAAEDSEAYSKAYEALEEAGLSRLSPNNGVRLPFTTVLGAYTSITGTIPEIRNSLRRTIERASGQKVARILVGSVGAWACSGNSGDVDDPKSSLDELFRMLRE